jgi:hypothetical protein
MLTVRRYKHMTKANEYKVAEERGWREQALPVHPKFSDMAERISHYLSQVDTAIPLPVKTGLSAVVETAISYVYREWIERKADYPADFHDAGVQVYGEVVLMNQVKKQVKVYLKADTVEKIDAIGNFLGVTAYHTPYLFSTGHKGVYNRKLIIILAMNALSEHLKAR